MDMQQADLDVIVVGGGPVGLGLAIDLTLRGKKVCVLERSVALHRIPKGQNLTQRTGEHFRAWGVGEAIRTASPIPRDFGNAGLMTYGKLLSAYRYDWFQRSKVAAYYFADNERLPQYETERVLRDRLNELDPDALKLGCKFTALDASDDQVVVTFDAEAGSQQTIAAPYVVGCDGARSAVREQAGIAQAVDHQGPRMALLVFRSDGLDELLAEYTGKSIFNIMNPELDGYWQFLGRFDLNGGWFYHFPVPADATAENYDFTTHLHQMVGASFALEFEHIGFWDLRISHAKTYQAGRVFIAGDAAHSHPPYGGYGVNTGLEDARNLSWKLAARLDGWGSEGLLESYSAERHPVFKSTSRDFIERMITDFRTFMDSYDPVRDKQAFEAAWQARAAGDDSDVTEFLPHYAGSSAVWGDAQADSGARGKHSFQARPGYHLAPAPDRANRDLWPELGSGFTLLDFKGHAALTQEFADAAAALQVPLAVVSSADADLAAHYGADAILVRPDQFIAWTADNSPVRPAEILARAIGRR